VARCKRPAGGLPRPGCQQQGSAPQVPCKGSFNVRVGHDLHLAAVLTAAQQNVTLNDLTRQALRNYLQHNG
jgi:predicted HicB family RNase H-like nuclease